jgi:hypothetical protein
MNMWCDAIRSVAHSYTSFCNYFKPLGKGPRGPEQEADLSLGVSPLLKSIFLVLISVT